MNEKIKGLAEQAGFMLWQNESWNPGDIIDWSARYDKELEAFADLIVQECISTIENAENGYQDYRNQIEDSMRNHCIGLIKNKFRVE